MARYKLTENNGVSEPGANRSFGADDDNRHAVEYREWLADGNIPDPSDPPSPPGPSKVFGDAPVTVMVWCALTLLYYEMRGVGKDDRPSTP